MITIDHDKPLPQSEEQSGGRRRCPREEEASRRGEQIEPAGLGLLWKEKSESPERENMASMVFRRNGKLIWFTAWSYADAKEFW